MVVRLVWLMAILLVWLTLVGRLRVTVQVEGSFGLGVASKAEAAVSAPVAGKPPPMKAVRR
ncbi:hypothetical protein D3C72_2460650 [compost metagenome]